MSSRARSLVLRFHLIQASPSFHVRDHISYWTTVRGPDILRSVIISAYVTF